MKESGFRFNDEQREALLTCWKRPRDREIAALYLQEVELLIADWQSNNARNPPTAIKQQIALANKLRMNVEKIPELLEQLPKDFEERLATVWLYKKYGDKYFELHEDACRKDMENNTARKLIVAAMAAALSPNGAASRPSVVFELSKLPPNYFQQSKTDADFLRIVASAAGEIAWMLRGSKAWTEKPNEEGLLFLLAFSYEHHFGKLPSASNANREGYPSPFRSFLEALAKIITAQSYHLQEYKFGAVITRNVLKAIRDSRCVN